MFNSDDYALISVVLNKNKKKCILHRVINNKKYN